MSTFDRVKILHFDQKGDERGKLVIAEGDGIDIPFAIKRVFYIYESDANVIRGCHANRKSEFVMINVSGTSKIRVEDGMGHESVYALDRPHMGIYLPSMLWKEMYSFSQDSVLLVLASEHYDASEYIRDYGMYLQEIRSTGKEERIY